MMDWTSRAFSALVLALQLSPFAGASAQQQDQAFRILVTNDDGVAAPGLEALRRALEPLGEVVVVAPAMNESGSSHSTRTVGRALAVWPYQGDARRASWAVDGSPADATRFGLLELGGSEGFDLVMSGINAGANLGVVSHYSGTVGAAMEAAYNGVPGIAVSVDRTATQDDYANAATLASRLARVVLEGEGLGTGVVLNLNIPLRPVKGVVVRRMGSAHVVVRGYDRMGASADTVHWRAQLEAVRVTEQATDTRAFQDGWAVITPLLFDRTAIDALERLERRDLQRLLSGTEGVQPPG